MARRIVAVVLLTALSACAGGATEPAADSTATGTAPEPTTRQIPPGAADAVEDLSDFSCESGEDGRWSAAGIITNSTADTASYAVTVVVTGTETQDARAKQRTLAALRAGEPTAFAIGDVPVTASTDLSCSVRVVRLR